MREFEQFAEGGVLKPIDARDAVTAGKHASGFTDVNAALEALDLVLQDVADFSRSDLCHNGGCLAAVIRSGSAGPRQAALRGWRRRFFPRARPSLRRAIRDRLWWLPTLFFRKEFRDWRPDAQYPRGQVRRQT